MAALSIETIGAVVALAALFAQKLIFLTCMLFVTYSSAASLLQQSHMQLHAFTSAFSTLSFIKSWQWNGHSMGIMNINKILGGLQGWQRICILLISS